MSDAPFQPHENLDSDFQFAKMIHNKENGIEAEQVLQIQRQRDAVQARVAVKPILRASTSAATSAAVPNVARRYYSWQIPPAKSSQVTLPPLVNSSIFNVPWHAQPATSTAVRPKVRPQVTSTVTNSIIALTATTSSAIPQPSTSIIPQPSTSIIRPTSFTPQSHIVPSSGKITKTPKPNKAVLRQAAVQYMASNQPGTSSSVPQPLANLTPLPNSTIGKVPIVAQNIKISTKRKQIEDFYMPGLNTFINCDLGDWREINVEPNLKSLFGAICGKFFKGIPRVSYYQLQYDDARFSNMQNFEIDPVEHRIYLNRKTMLKCSRTNLLSVLFHITIHCAVYETSNAFRKKIDDHDVNFHEVMKFFNENLDLEIGTDHTFLRAHTEELDSYKCFGGICSGLFNGIIKCQPREEVPPQIIATAHQNACKGKFHRIFEVTRTLNNNIETKYVTHKEFENPTAAAGDNSEAHHKTNMEPRELVDITSEEDGAPKVVPLTKVIDLEDAEFTDRKKQVRKVVETIKKNAGNNFTKCFICESSLEEHGGFRRHLNLCLNKIV